MKKILLHSVLLLLSATSALMGCESSDSDTEDSLTQYGSDCPTADFFIDIVSKLKASNGYNGKGSNAKEYIVYPLDTGPIARQQGLYQYIKLAPQSIRWGNYPDPYSFGSNQELTSNASSRFNSYSTDNDAAPFIPCIPCVPRSGEGVLPQKTPAVLSYDGSVKQNASSKLPPITLEASNQSSFSKHNQVSSSAKKKSNPNVIPAKKHFWTWKKVVAAGVVTGGAVGLAAYYFYPRTVTDKSASAK